MEYTPEQQEIIKKRRSALAPFYGDHMNDVKDDELLVLSDAEFAALVKGLQDPPVTRADLEAMQKTMEDQRKIIADFMRRAEAQDQALTQLSKNVEQVAQAVTPLVKAFSEFQKEDGAAAAPQNGIVPHNGNGGGKMDIMSLLQNPLVQKLLLGGGEQGNPSQAVLNQVQFVAQLKESLDSIGGRNIISGGKPANWDKRDFMEGMRWGYRIKDGKMPAGLLKALTEDDGDDGKGPRIIVVEQPAAVDKNRRESDGEHLI